MQDAATGKTEKLVELFRRLIAFDTTSGRSNIGIADHLDGFLTSHGCRTARFANAAGDRVNLVAMKGPDAASGLMLCGHVDVVPAAEPDWAGSPFEIRETRDAYFGRGTADMKGFVALAAHVLAETDAANLSKPLVGLFTYDEEVGTIGASDFGAQWDNRWHLPAAAIVGEPTGLNAVRMHKGHLKLRITIRGKSAHSGYPHLGSNAIEKLGRVLVRLADFADRLKAERLASSAFFPETPHAALNPAMVRGGEALNIVPDHCELDLGVRVLPGQDSADIARRITNEVTSIDGLAGDIDVSVLGDSPPMLTSEDSPLYQRLCALTGQQGTVAVSYASDAGPLSRMGVSCVLFGPGNIEVAHKANEFLPKQQLHAARELISRLVEDWCG